MMIRRGKVAWLVVAEAGKTSDRAEKTERDCGLLAVMPRAQAKETGGSYQHQEAARRAQDCQFHRMKDSGAGVQGSCGPGPAGSPGTVYSKVLVRRAGVEIP